MKGFSLDKHLQGCFRLHVWLAFFPPVFTQGRRSRLSLYPYQCAGLYIFFKLSGAVETMSAAYRQDCSRRLGVCNCDRRLPRWRACCPRCTIACKHRPSHSYIRKKKTRIMDTNTVRQRARVHLREREFSNGVPGLELKESIFWAANHYI